MAAIWTIGYQSRTPNDLIHALHEAGVELLVDVRIRPQSRKPGFSKRTLGAELEAAGIAYEHVGELGTPYPIRDHFRAGDIETGAKLYREHLLNDASDELEQLAVRAADTPTALLCFEFQPAECHRRVITQELTRLHGYDVIDIT
jgi:uncharacterized protein (DUF488 family)